MRSRFVVTLLGMLVLGSTASARAALPDADTLLADLGFSSDAIAEIKAGHVSSGSAKPGTERELAAGFAFHVGIPPAELIGQLKGGLLTETDPNTISAETIATGALADFAKLSLGPNANDRVKAYLNAKPGDALNLSTAEIAAFANLNSTGKTSQADVEQLLRTQLLARYQEYQRSGLAGITPYDRGGGKTRSPGDELRSAVQSSKAVQKYAPAFDDLLSNYPASKPKGLEEGFRWVQFSAHGEPTIALVHGMFVPDGDGWVVAQRQFYVSSGFNCEQAVAAFLPVSTGTVVVYGNRTSTDQVAGMGGSMKRSIGSNMLASQLQEIFAKLQKTAPVP